MARILCVDDEPEAVFLRKEMLEKAGYSVTPCYSVPDAIRELEGADYDAVVTDWRLGDSCGSAIVHAAKTKPGVPVVVVSGYVGEAFHATEPMADIYLEKPADARELLHVLKILLDVRTKRTSKAHF